MFRMSVISFRRFRFLNLPFKKIGFVLIQKSFQI